MENDNDYYVTRSAITGPDEADQLPLFSKPIGEHLVKAKIQILYGLERMPKEDKKDHFRKFYATYYFGSSCEGKTESLAWNLNSWQSIHDITVNTNFIADIYENPITFTLFEVVKAENATLSSIQSKFQAFGSDFKTFKGGWASSNERRISLEALAKRKFSLAKNGLNKLNKRRMSVKQFITLPETALLEADISTSRPVSTPSSDSSRSATPHPHHFQHPEKHIESETGTGSLKKSRSASSLAALKITRPKTPPSPHHGNHPLDVLAPYGTVLGKDILHSNITATPKTNELTGGNQKGSNTGEKDDVVKDETASRNHSQAKKKGTVKFEDSSTKSQKNPPTEESPINKAKSTSPVREKRKEFVTIPVAKVTMDLADLFMGQTEIKHKVDSISTKIEGIKFLSFSIQLDQQLLSPEQVLVLNPMCIKIQTADGMPSNPNGFSYLDEKCHRVFCKFRFFGDPHVHESFSRDPHGPVLRFNTKHLVLPGLIDEEKLSEDLLRKKFKIHDRDARLPDDLNILAKGIGTDGKITSINNSKAPYGIAEFDLSELAIGKVRYESTTQIVPFEPGTKDHESLPPAQWLENFSSINLSISLPYPILTKSIQLTSSPDIGSFARIAILADCKNIGLFELIRTFIDSVNSEALHIDEKSSKILLSGYKLSQKQQISKSLNILCGYHIFDSQTRMILFEGVCRDKIGNLISTLERYSDAQIFHSPETTFSSKLWKLYTPGLCHIKVNNIQTLANGKLHGKIAKFISTLYSKNTPFATKLLEFPNSNIIYTLLKGEGVVVSEEDAWNFSETPAESITDLEKPNLAVESLPKPNLSLAYIIPTQQFMSRIRSTPKRIQDRNPTFKSTPFRVANFVMMNAKKTDSSNPYLRSTESTVFNYSIQTKSSTASQLEKLKSLALKDTKYIHVYGPELYSPAISFTTESPKAKKYDFWAGPFKKG